MSTFNSNGIEISWKRRNAKYVKNNMLQCENYNKSIIYYIMCSMTYYCLLLKNSLNLQIFDKYDWMNGIKRNIQTICVCVFVKCYNNNIYKEKLFDNIPIKKESYITASFSKEKFLFFIFLKFYSIREFYYFSNMSNNLLFYKFNNLQLKSAFNVSLVIRVCTLFLETSL